MGMVERRDGAPLTFHALFQFWRRRKMRSKNFDRHSAIRGGCRAHGKPPPCHLHPAEIEFRRDRVSCQSSGPLVPRHYSLIRRSGSIIVPVAKRSHRLKTIASCLALCAIVTLSPAFALVQSAPAIGTQSQAQPTTEPPHELKVTEYRLPPDKLAKAEALYKIRTVLYLFSLFFGILVLWGLLKLR